MQVGPDASAIIGFRTVVATGAAVGAPNSVRAVASALLAKPEQALVVTTSEVRRHAVPPRAANHG